MARIEVDDEGKFYSRCPYAGCDGYVGIDDQLSRAQAGDDAQVHCDTCNRLSRLTTNRGKPVLKPVMTDADLKYERWRQGKSEAA